MSKPALLTSTASFAHLQGTPAAKPAAVTPRAESGDDDMKKLQEDLAAAEKRAEDAEQRAAAAEEEVKKLKASKKDPDEDDDEDDDEEGDDDSDREEMSRPKSRVGAARKRERARCAAIFAVPEAANNTRLAAELAFATDLTRSAALAVMKAAPAQVTGRTGLSARMAVEPTPVVGPDPGPAKPEANDPKTLAESIVATARRARGK